MTNARRVNIGKQHPAAYKALIALSAEVEENAAAAALTADQISAVAWLASVMNVFNRVAITSRYPTAG